ncbi:MAG: phosphotransferase enzyme family protein [Thermodesulfobacteriota bacterium]
MTVTLDAADKAVPHFFPAGAVAATTPYGSGKVNDTFLVRVTGNDQVFLLQHLSRLAFPRPELVMANLRLVCDHVAAKMARELTADSRWEMVTVRPALSGADCWFDEQGDCWRVLHLIDNTVCVETVENIGQAREIGFALGRFHELISDLDPNRLADTLPGFHVTPGYLARYDRVRQSPAALRASGAACSFCRQFIDRRRRGVAVLEEAAAQGRIVLRPIHGDPKPSNVLFDKESGRAVSLIDLDTVKPGLLLYDLGDCLRACCNRGGEEDEGAVLFDADLCRAVLQGYGEAARVGLGRGDVDLLFDATRLIALELGIRFFIDHLEGDPYFKTAYAGQNLERALVQFRLVASIEEQEASIRAMARELEQRR